MKYSTLVFLALASTLLFSENKSWMRANGQAVTSRQNSSSTSRLPQWISPTVFGLRLGSARERDIRKLLGKPWWEGPNVEKAYPNDPEDEILLQYNNVGEEKDDVDFAVGKKSRIIKSVAVYPTRRQTKQEVLAEFGSEFVEIESSESMCVSEKRLQSEGKNSPQYPIVLVYPSRGMYVMLNEDQRVNHVGYGMKCFD